MTTGYALGFQSVEREHAGVELDVEGRIPGWLDGSLLRNGPARFEVGGERVAHWFDGLGMLRRFAFDGGRVTYTDRFLRSRAYERVTEAGRMDGDQFGTEGRGLLGALRDLVLPRPTDNANVNVLRMGDRFVAVTETPVGVAFDPETLETLERVRFADLDGQMMTAHPHVDPETGETVTFSTHFGRTNRYVVSRRLPGGSRFHEVGAVPTDRPSYLHSFGLSRNYAVLAEIPFDVSPLRLLLPGGGAFIERYRWRPEEGTRFVVVDRDSGAVTAEVAAEPFFTFHHANAFEDGDALCVDLVAFDDPSVVDALYLDELEAGIPTVEAELRRYRVPLDGGEAARETVYDGGLTLPRVSPERNTRPYRYAYGQGTPSPDGRVPARLVKVDVGNHTATEWVDEGTYPGEPVFVPRPGGRAEDDGVVLSVVLDAAAEASVLVVLDGETFAEIGRARLPDVVPFDFHGQYVER